MTIDKKEEQMALNINDTKFLEIAEIICEEGLSGLDKAVQIIINQAMLIERDHHLKKEPPNVLFMPMDLNPNN